MKLRDRLGAAVQTFREVPDLRSRLDTAERELKHAKQTVDQWEQECVCLRDTIEEKDSRLRFLDARSSALLSALTEFSPKLSSTEEMKRFYDTISCDLDPEGFTLYRVAKNLAGVEVTGLFPYEDACGLFELANGYMLMNYLTAYCFGAVEWEIVPRTTYERAVLGEVDETTPEYQRFERQLYESALKRMGFDELLAPEQTEPAPVQMQGCTAQPANTMHM